MSETVLQAGVDIAGLSFDPVTVSEPLMWLVLAAFLGSVVVAQYDERLARPVGTVGWGLFAVYWLVLAPHFILIQKSVVEGLGSVIAVPLSLYTGYLLWNGRESLLVLTRAIGIMGVIYVPFLTIGPLRQTIIEAVTDQVAFLMTLIGYEPTVVGGLSHNGIDITSKQYPYENTFWFGEHERPITYTIILACTGIGSISIFAGGILAVKAPWRRKLRVLLGAVGIIYVLNLLRNLGIALAFGLQKAQFFPETVMALFGLSDAQLVSYYIVDRMLAQFGSVIVLVGLTWVLMRELPELTVIIEDLLFLVTGTEYDLGTAFEKNEPESGPATPGDD
ncbi:archaeosortase A [Haloarcula argentinensis]|uniref:Archaeosortase A n=1 Tax=Haloarcula argentinensis TaxID=43776 RepID=A0A847UEW0_HALAR|nr:archaeosortase A [Haloarcula argentinensis]NLV12075.1 archaeosortase A [Haloarcula argentinensis]